VRWVGWYAAIEDLIPTLPPSAFAAWQLARLPEDVAGSVLCANLSQTIRDVTTRNANEPSATVEAFFRPVRMPRAFLVDGATKDDGTTATVRTATDPAFTITSTATKRVARAWLSQGRVVRMTPRALARFQAFPDTYALPDKAALACRVIGNAVPPLLMQTIGDNW
jgi:DNA (cytosine-5)-methyltransferase 1